MAVQDDTIFIGRDQQLDLFDIYLSRWRQAITSSTETQVKTSPSSDNPIQGLIVLLYGRGGFGKTSLLARYSEIAQKQQGLVVSKTINWGTKMQDRSGLLKIVQSANDDASEFFAFFAELLQEALDKPKADFKEYLAAAKEVEDTKAQIRSTLNELQVRSQKDDIASTMKGLTVDGLMVLIKTTPIGSLLQNTKISDGVAKILGAGVDVGVDQLTHIYQKVQRKLGNDKLDIFRAPELRLGLALGKDLARFARNYPILIFFDTYEEVDEVDALIRIVMAGAQARVGWVIAGRSNLWAGPDQQKRRMGIEYGYKDIVPTDRALAIDFNVGGVGAFTVRDIIEYFTLLKKQSSTQSLLNPPTAAEADQILQLTQGVPLAVKIASAIYQETGDFDFLTRIDKEVNNRRIVQEMVERYLLHARDEQDERNKLYGLAMLRRANQPSAVACVLNLPAEQIQTGYDAELRRLHRRYSFIFSGENQPELHMEVRFFLRQWLRDNRLNQPNISAINTRIKQTYETFLQEQEVKDQKDWNDLVGRLENDEWRGIYLDYIEELFWLDPADGVRQSIPLLIASALYQPRVLPVIIEIGNFFLQDIKIPYISWWNYAVKSLENAAIIGNEPENLQTLLELEKIFQARNLTFQKPIPAYQQELQAMLSWHIARAYTQDDYQLALQRYEQALSVFPQDPLLQEHFEHFIMDTAKLLFDAQKYQENIVILNKAIEVMQENSFLQDAHLQRGLVYLVSHEYQQAADDFSQAIRLDPEDSWAYLLRGSLNNEFFNNYEQALQDYEKALEFNKHEALIYVERGLLYYRYLSQIDNALADFNRALELDSNEEAIYHNLALLKLDLGKLEEALQDANHGLELNPDSSIAYVGRGMVYIAFSEYQRAKLDFQRAIELDKMLYHAYVGLGALYIQLQDWENALQNINHVLSLNPNHFGAFYLRGMAHYNRMDYQRAKLDFQHALALNSNCAVAYYGLGLVNLSTHDIEQAIQQFKQALSLGPHLAIVYYGLGTAYTTIKDFSHALESFDHALEINPRLPFAYCGRGEMYAAQKDFSRALQEYQLALDIDPFTAQAYLGRGQIYTQMLKNRQAIQEFSQAIELLPNLSLAYSQRGLVYMDLQDLTHASEDFDRAIMANSRFASAYAGKGLLAITIGNVEQALALSNKALELDDSLFLAYYARGLAYAGYQDYDQALQDLEHAILLDPTSFLAYNGRGLMRVDMEQYIEAMQDFTHVLSINENYFPTYYGRGMAYLGLDNPQAAIQDFNKAIQLNPTFVGPYVGRGRAYISLEDFQQAIQNFNRALSLNINQIDAYLWRGIAHTAWEDYTSALKDFNSGLSFDENNFLFLMYRGINYREMGNHSLALKDYNHILALNPELANAYYLRALVYKDIEDQQHAIDDLNTALSLKPTDIDAYEERAALFAASQKYEQALTDYSMIIQNAPDYSLAYEYRADIYCQIGELPSAIADYTTAIQQGLTDASIYNKRAYAYMQNKDYEQALGDFNEAMEHEMTNSLYYGNRGYCYLFLRKLALAQKDFITSIGLDQTNITSMWMSSYTAFGKSHKGVETAKQLEAIAIQNPTHEVALLCQAIALSLRGKLRDGITFIEQAIEKNATRADAHFWRGMLFAYYYRNRSEAASESIKHALTLNLPPILLTPLYWLEQDCPSFYNTYAKPLLLKYDI